MIILQNGYATDTFKTDNLIKGLRSSQYSSRNTKQLEVCQGMVGFEEALKTIPTLQISSVMEDPNIILNDFPFPQLFILDKHILICNRQSILELKNNIFEVVISSIPAKGKWNVLSFFDFIYLTNGEVSIIRSPETHTYSISSTAPIGTAIHNFNGQIIVGVTN